MLSLIIKSKFGVFTQAISNVGGLLTYEIPPKTSILGILGATLGYDFIETVNNFKDIKIGIQIINPINTERIIFNSHYGGRAGRMLNIKQEILISPAYQIFIDFSRIKELEREYIKKTMINLLKDHEIKKNIKTLEEGFRYLFSNKIAYYSPYMGRNSFPLNINLQDLSIHKLKSSEMKNKSFKTYLAVPRDAISDFKVPVKLMDGIPIPEELNVILLNKIPIAYRIPEDKEKYTREISEFKNFILPPVKHELTVIPVNNKNYSYNLDDQDNLIVCF